MKKLLLFLLLVGTAFAQTTPNLALNIPAYNTPNWQVLMNANFSALDSDLSGVNILPAFKAASIFIGNAASNSAQLTGTFGANRVVTFPDVSITVGSLITEQCGTTVACSATISNNQIVAFGSAPLSSASPSTASITGLPFTGSATYWCQATPEGTTAAVAAGGVAINKTGASTMTLTGPNTVTTVIDYTCYGT